MWRNLRFLHIYHALKSEISPHDNFLSTTLITDISNTYQVCHCYQWSTVLRQSARLCRVQNCAECKIIQCKIMQSAKLCRVQNVAECKMLQGVRLCRVQNYSEWTIMQSARLCSVQDFTAWKIVQSAKLCRDKIMQVFFLPKVFNVKISKTGWGSK